MGKKQQKHDWKKYMFIGKSIFFPEERILAFGDLHLGYETMIRKSGANVFLNQLEETKRDIDNIFKRIKEEGYSVNTIVLLGDLKHYFGYNELEENYIHELVVHLQTYVRNEKIIFVKGNHDKIDIANKTFKRYFACKDIIFVHGNESFHEIYGPKVKYVVMSHLHPTLTLRDKQNIKEEKYKCFLIGHFKKKEFIVVPSFLPLVEGSNIDEYEKTFSVVPYSELENFDVFIVGNDWIVRDFGKFKDI